MDAVAASASGAASVRFWAWVVFASCFLNIDGANASSKLRIRVDLYLPKKSFSPELELYSVERSVRRKQKIEMLNCMP